MNIKVNKKMLKRFLDIMEDFGVEDKSKIKEIIINELKEEK